MNGDSREPKRARPIVMVENKMLTVLSCMRHHGLSIVDSPLHHITFTDTRYFTLFTLFFCFCERLLFPIQ